MTYNKFIIEGDDLIIGVVTYHKQLATNKDEVKGGGWWRKDNGVYTFGGRSQDFGRAKETDIKKAIENNRVFTNPSQTRAIPIKNYRIEQYY